MSLLSGSQYPQEVYWPPKCVWADVRHGLLLLKPCRRVSGSTLWLGGFGGGCVEFQGRVARCVLYMGLQLWCSPHCPYN